VDSGQDVESLFPSLFMQDYDPVRGTTTSSATPSITAPERRSSETARQRPARRVSPKRAENTKMAAETLITVLRCELKFKEAQMKVDTNCHFIFIVCNILLFFDCFEEAITLIILFLNHLFMNLPKATELDSGTAIAGPPGN